MARAPFQVLVIPYIKSENGYRFVLFRRADRPFEMWQPITGGVEEGETLKETAVRETAEECGHTVSESSLIDLDFVTRIPAREFPNNEWGDATFDIPEHAFGVELADHSIRLSEEHTSFEWLDIEKARRRLYWEANVRALNRLYDLLKKNEND